MTKRELIEALHEQTAARAMLQQELSRRQTELEQRDAVLALRDAELIALRDAKQDLEARYAAMTRALFSPKREHGIPADPGQQCIFSIPVETAPEADAAAATETTTIMYERPVRRGRRAVPKDLPTIEKIISVPESERIGPKGEALVLLGYDTSTRLHLIPESLVQLVIKRERVGLADTRETLITAPPLAALIPKGKLSDDFVHQIVLRKYLLGLPLYRQAQDLERRLGSEISRSTLCDAVNRSAEVYRGISEAILATVRTQRLIHADETPIRQLRGGADGASAITGYFWVLYAGNQVVFHYAPSRAQSVVKTLFGIDDDEPWDPGGLIALMCDGYVGYNPIFDATLAERPPGEPLASVTRLACWSHVRRKFSDLRDTYQHARDLVTACDAVFRVEREAKHAIKRQELSGDAADALHRDYRQRDGALAVANVKAILERIAPLYPDNMKMFAAIRYALKLWPSLIAYLASGDLPMSNNDCERAIRPIAIGRKNYLFVGSEDGGEHAAIWYTIIENCRLQRINPQRYLEYVTPKLITGDPGDLTQLTPAALAGLLATKAASG